MKKFVAHDLFGERVGVNYAGKSTYQTNLGTIISLLSTTLVLFYAVTRIELLVTISQPDKSSQLEYIKRVGHEGVDIHKGNLGLATSVWDGKTCSTKKRPMTWIMSLRRFLPRSAILRWFRTSSPLKRARTTRQSPMVSKSVPSQNTSSTTSRVKNPETWRTTPRAHCASGRQTCESKGQ